MTLIIIIVTVIFSIIAFNNRDIFQKYSFNAYAIKNYNEWYRFFTYGLLHADWVHLLINMLVLYSFGEVVETYFKYYFGIKAYLYYILLYIGGIVFSVTYDFWKHKDDKYYNSIGASGAVSAVIFSSIIFYPCGKIYIFLIPIGIPSIIFGILYLAYSAYMARKAIDNIGHDAHFWGAVFGIVYTIILKPKLVLIFIEQIHQVFI